MVLEAFKNSSDFDRQLQSCPSSAMGSFSYPYSSSSNPLIFKAGSGI
jgi:hypothetical protein